MSVKQEIIDAAARAGFVQAWASYMEEKGKSPGRGGQDLMDLAPKTPSKAKTWAKKLIDRMEEINGTTAAKMYANAAQISLSHGKGGVEPETFGHYTAMQALGHGVAWSDDHPAHGYRIPSASFDMLGSRNFYTSVDFRTGLETVG
jgi:hypothetical protein